MPDRSAKAWAADGLPGWCQFEHDVDSWIAGIGMIGSENINRGVRERGRRHEIGFAVLIKRSLSIFFRRSGTTRKPIPLRRYGLSFSNAPGRMAFAYIERARPRVTTPRLFITDLVPIRPMTRVAVKGIVRRALIRAGV
jgi:hypothetical protein